MTSRAEVFVRAPAKVNLSLKVGPPREDGYHDLATVFHAVSLFDDVRAVPADDFQVHVEGLDADAVPTDDSNLAVRAALALAEDAGVDAGVHLDITKGIPVAGGMAGGSADAAAALVACDALWGTRYPRARLAGLAARIGSDVPFALSGGTAIGTGRGEMLSPLLGSSDLHWVVGLADGQLSTPKVFRECDRLRSQQDVPHPEVSSALLEAMRDADPHRVGAELENDLQPAACSLMPSLEHALDAGRTAGALGSLVSGSGPTVVFLVADSEHGIEVGEAMERSGTVRAVSRCRGPVPGARVVEPVAHRG